MIKRFMKVKKIKEIHRAIGELLDLLVEDENSQEYNHGFYDGVYATISKLNEECLLNEEKPSATFTIDKGGSDAGSME